MSAAFASGIDPQRAVAAIRWDPVNPWGALLEKLSSHPLVARRIAALETSGLPGRPQVWSVLRAGATATTAEEAKARAGFGGELALACCSPPVTTHATLWWSTGSIPGNSPPRSGMSSVCEPAIGGR